jgi:hypothetical protein
MVCSDRDLTRNSLLHSQRIFEVKAVILSHWTLRTANEMIGSFSNFTPLSFVSTTPTPLIQNHAILSFHLTSHASLFHRNLLVDATASDDSSCQDLNPPQDTFAAQDAISYNGSSEFQFFCDFLSLLTVISLECDRFCHDEVLLRVMVMSVRSRQKGKLAALASSALLQVQNIFPATAEFFLTPTFLGEAIVLIGTLELSPKLHFGQTSRDDPRGFRRGPETV